MAKRNVLFVAHAAVLGGAELYLLDIARSLRGTSRVVLFEHGPFEARLRDEEIPVSVLPAARAFLDVHKSEGFVPAIKALPELLKLIVKLARISSDYELLFANSLKSILAAGPAGVLVGRPVVWSIHDILTADLFSCLNRQVTRLCASLFATRVIVNSQAARSAFVESGGHPDQTVVVYNGIDASRFDRIKPLSVDRLRNQFRIPAECPLVGMFSRLSPGKGQHVLLEALPDLPSVHAIIVGDVQFSHDSWYKAELEQTVHQLGIQDRVHFLGFRYDVPLLMQQLDVVLLTSVAAESFGRVAVEAMLAGKPVIVSSVGGPREIVHDSETGLMVPPGDARALAKAIRKVVANPTFARSMGEKARKLARRRFGIAAMVDEVQRVIRQACP